MTFSKRENEVLQLICQEKSNKEIATIMNISISTVETHKRNMFRKNGVHTSLGLVKKALNNGLLILEN